MNGASHSSWIFYADGTEYWFVPLQGITLVVVICVFIGIFLYNRHRRRLASRGGKGGAGRRIPDPLGSALGQGVGRDIYADPYAEVPTGLDEMATPRADKFGHAFGRPPIDRLMSEEWEMPYETEPPTSRGVAVGRAGNRNAKGKEKAYGQGGGSGVGAGASFEGRGGGGGSGGENDEPDEAAIPLHSRSPRPASPGWDPSSRANRNIPSDSRAHLDPFGRHAEINADDPHLSPPVAKRDLRTTTYESPSVESFEVELERGHTGGRQRGMTRSSSMSSEGSERIARVEGGARETGRLAQGHESSETLT
jgi:hypothetical protein